MTSAFESHWDEYYPKVYGYFFRRLEQREDVEDLTSMVMTQFMLVLLDQEKCNRIENKLSYLWKIAHNHLVDFIATKKKRVIMVALDEDVSALDESLEKLYSRHVQERQQAVLKCVEHSLSSQDLELVQLSIMEDKQSAEVGKVLQLTAGNVRIRLYRALEKLRDKCREIWGK
jgi:RNA polymerase sigma-70 factor (ECF subfamily)